MGFNELFLAKPDYYFALIRNQQKIWNHAKLFKRHRKKCILFFNFILNYERLSELNRYLSTSAHNPITFFK